jgi:hypothetical protein
MPALKTYDLFLSHVWRNSENSEYYRLEKLLKAQRGRVLILIRQPSLLSYSDTTA